MWLRHLNGGIPWWMWFPLLAAALVLLVLGAGLFPLVIVLLCWAAAAFLGKNRQDPPDVEARAVAGRPRASTESMVARASNERLCELWAESGRELKRAYLPTTIMSQVQLRESLLGEMQRRDPEAVDRWLADQPHQRDPRMYLDST